jgi:hypothetical protein
MTRAFDEELRSLENAYRAGGYTTAVLRALEGMPPGTLKMVDGQCSFTPRATSAQPTRSKTARVSHLQRRALCALVLSGDGALVTRAPVADEREAAEYIPADFNPPR